MTAAGAVEPFWLTVFLDYPASEFDAGADFWRSATGYALSPARGDAGEFATLHPAEGDAYLKVQRLGDGPTRLHLDVHVDDLRASADAAVAAGATPAEESSRGYVELSSPAGFRFCLVAHAAGSVPEAAAWAGHRSRVSRFCLDVPRKQYAEEVAFFQRLLGGSWLGMADPETALRPAGNGPLDVRLQPAELTREVTSHLHVITDDLEGEVARLAALGARPRAARRGKTILEVPGGSAVCVVALEAVGLT